MEPQSFFAYLLQGAALGLTAAVSPGPLQTFLVSESLIGGWRDGFPIAFAPLISDMPIILLVLLLLNQLPNFFLRFISLAGGIFVLNLALATWKDWRTAGSQPDLPVPIKRGGLRRGIMLNLLNPNPYLFWTLVNGPILLTALRQSSLYAGAYLLGFYGIFVGGMLVIVSVLHQARRLGPRVTRPLQLVSIFILIAFGALLIKNGLWP